MHFVQASLYADWCHHQLTPTNIWIKCHSLLFVYDNFIVVYCLTELQSIHIYFNIFSVFCVAADVFELISKPKYASKALTVSSSYFEIYSGKVCTCVCMRLTYVNVLYNVTQTHECMCTHRHARAHTHLKMNCACGTYV